MKTFLVKYLLNGMAHESFMKKEHAYQVHTDYNRQNFNLGYYDPSPDEGFWVLSVKEVKDNVD
jgi:hypothetical protein